ncbi:DUF2184 domain-containing protein [Stenotrophomonas phage B2]|nr:DUF2184 domain-containing protein [Stenotrophomonas phage B2]
MSAKTTPVHLHMNGRLASKRRSVQVNRKTKLTHSDLAAIGVNIRNMDSALIGPPTSSGHLPGHLLETWLPGTLRVVTQLQNIDEIVGATTVGKWEDEFISVRVAEPVAKAELYGDHTNIPLASYRQTIERRGVVRFEQGFHVGKLEDARQSAIGYQAAEEKRQAVSESLDTSRNQVGFYGYNDGVDTNVYGLLNDPSLPPYTTAPVPWLTATFDQLVADFQSMVSALERQMGGRLKDDSDFAFVLPTGYRTIFSTYQQTGNGMTFRQWLKESYPNMRIVTTPEFEGANGGKDVAYLFVENAGDLDDSQMTNASVIQAVPVRYMVLGSENQIKGYLEDAANATAGIFTLRPWAFTRKTIS